MQRLVFSSVTPPMCQRYKPVLKTAKPLPLFPFRCAAKNSYTKALFAYMLVVGAELKEERRRQHVKEKDDSTGFQEIQAGGAQVYLCHGLRLHHGLHRKRERDG